MNLSYHYTAVYRILGVLLPQGTDHLDLVIPASGRAGVSMTTRLEESTREIDQSSAIGYLLLTGGMSSPSIDQKIEEQVREIQAERRSRFSSGHFLVIRGEGEAPPFSPAHSREHASFVVCLNGAPKAELKERWKHEVSVAIAALPLALKRVITAELVAEGFVFFREDGKPVYSYTIEASGGGTVSTSMAPEALGAIQRVYKDLLQHRGFERVTSLLSASMGLRSDTFRAFLTAWSSLEILINKAFTEYNDALFTELKEHESSLAKREYFDRILGVMEDKYRLVDKFIVVASHLAPSDADGDLGHFKAAKKIRDDLAHGVGIKNDLLPVESVKELAGKYLALHVAKT
jgi:hypothetical protein